jgi:hypothetical protein
MSTKFDIEVTLVELINNNFLLFKNDLNLSAFVLGARRLGYAIPLTLAKYHFLD